MIGFGSIGTGEILVILALALLLFGPRRIPEIGRTIGKTLAEFRKATGEFKSGLEREIEMEKIHDATAELREVRTDITELAKQATSGIGASAVMGAGADRPTPTSPTTTPDPVPADPPESESKIPENGESPRES